MKIALNEKRKKLRGFSFSINIANFEAFLSVFMLTKNPLFLKQPLINYRERLRDSLCTIVPFLYHLIKEVRPNKEIFSKKEIFSIKNFFNKA